jgi:hypothetical protein
MTEPNLATPEAQPETSAPPNGTSGPDASAPPQSTTPEQPGPPAPAGQPAAVKGDGEAGGAPTAARRRDQAVTTVRRHWLFSALLAAGLVMRVLAQIAYRPALIYVDTLKYLYGASPGSEPLGYTAILRAILSVGGLATVAGLQHLLGLAMAVALYAVLLRRGVPRWLAALATAPVLLDAYQLQMEQMIMPDVWFEALVVAGLVVLLWRPTVSLPAAAAGGAILAVAATVMQLGEVLVVPAVIFTLSAGFQSGGGWRHALGRSAALAVAFGLVILGYCGLSYAHDGRFFLANRQSVSGRLAAAADCATLSLPANVRPLCPTPAQQANGPDWLEHSGSSPLHADHHGHLIGQLSNAVLGQQFPQVVASIARDSLRLFALTRDSVQSVTPISRWQFQTSYPTYPPWTEVCPAALTAKACLAQQQAIQQRVAPVSDTLLRPGGTIVIGVQRQAFGKFTASRLRLAYGRDARVNQPIAAFLRGYQLHGGYTPGPLLALFCLTGLAGSLLLLSRRLDGRTRQLALGCLLFTATAAAVLLPPDVYEYSWRYELPAVVTLVPAGVLGIWALVTMRKALTRPKDAAA